MQDYLHQWVPANKLTKGEHLLAANGTVATADGGTTPKVHDGWMWDLTVPGNNDHDFYVLAGYDAKTGSVPVLVHNCDGEVYWVKVNANMGDAARDYDAGAAGSQSGLAPALQYYKADSGTLSTIKFDGYDTAANQMIDRKVAVTTFGKTYQQSINQSINQSLALERNGMTGLWEVPNASQLARANQIFSDLGITNITARIAAP